MDKDLSINVVTFQLRRPSGEVAIGEGPTQSDDCVRQAWAMAREKHRAAPWEVSALHCEWEPSAADQRFIGATFPQAKAVTYNFSRPDPDGWEAAFAAARQTIAQTDQAAQRENGAQADQGMRAVQSTGAGYDAWQEKQHADKYGELLPILWSRRSPQREILDVLPYYELVPGRLLVTVAKVAPTPRGTFGMSHVTHGGLRGRSFADLMEEARSQLSTGLRIEVRNNPARPELGDMAVVCREGPCAVSAVTLPTFHEQMSEILKADRLVAGLVSAENLFVAPETSGAARMIRQTVPGSQCPDNPLVPTVVSITRSGYTVLYER